MKESKKKWKGIHIFWYIWICILTFAVLSSITHARYTSQAPSDNTSIEIAKPIITISKTTLSDVNNNPAKKEVAFSVQNYSLDTPSEISGTAMNYSLSISKKAGVPVNFILYSISGSTRQPVTLTNSTSSSFTIPHSTSTKHDYILELTFTAPPSISDIQDGVSIALNAEQKQI